MKVTNLLTEKDREVFDRIDRDCLAMHVPTSPKTFIELSVTDENGIEVERYTDRAHSWVRNAYNALFSMFGVAVSNSGSNSYGAGGLVVKNTAGTAVEGSATTLLTLGKSLSNQLGAIGSAAMGVVVGSSDSAESFDSHVLNTLIANGNSAGQMAYQAEASPSVVYDSETKKWTCVRSRVINNNSGSPIVVNEVGIIGLLDIVQNVLITRDLLASPVTVPNSGQLTVTYTIEMTFPA